MAHRIHISNQFVAVGPLGRCDAPIAAMRDGAAIDSRER